MLGLLGRKIWLVMPGSGHDRPCDARHFIRQSDSYQFEGFLRQQGSCPVRQWRLGFTVLDAVERRMCSNHQELSQMSVTHFGDPAKPRLAAAGILSRHQSQEGCEFSSTFEKARIRNARRQKRCRNWPNTRYRSKTKTDVVSAVYGEDQVGATMPVLRLNPWPNRQSISS
jgi:hypothetical protein